jgi:hypothetical protein
MLLGRASPSASFASESSGDDEHRRSDSPPLSEAVSRGSSSSNTVATTNCLMKRYASQARTNVLRSTSISPLMIRKQRQISLNSKKLLQHPILQNSTEIKSTLLIEKRTPQSQLTSREINIRKPSTCNASLTARSTSLNLPKVRQNFLLFIFEFFYLGISIK